MTVLLPQTILVPCSSELLHDMEGEWSQPLEIKAERDVHGKWQLTFRYADAPAPDRDPPDATRGG